MIIDATTEAAEPGEGIAPHLDRHGTQVEIAKIAAKTGTSAQSSNESR